ncbi:MAG: hypothetical protein V4719_16050 [Planctomycetota bacterium]
MMKQSEMRISGRRSAALVAGVLLGLSAVAGCGGGDDGPKRFDVRGVVKYNDKPVASGRVTFAPDHAKGNKGPAGWAMIQNGAYNTAGIGGKSPVAGAMTVLITGFAEMPAVKVETPEPLFMDYKTDAVIDSAKKLTTLDFDVPATAKRK